MAQTLPASREIIGEAVAAAAQELASATAATVQDEMFAPPAVPAPGARIEGAALEAEGERRRKGGRPPGAQNKSTRQLREWLLRGGVLPQKWMMDFLLMEPEQLAARLKCTVLEAFDRQVAIADKLGRYVMAPMAPSDDKGNTVPIFEFHLGATAGAGADVPPWELDARKRDLAAGLKPAIDGTAVEIGGAP